MPLASVKCLVGRIEFDFALHIAFYLPTDLFEIPHFRQRRQLIEPGQVEIIKKLSGGGIHGRPSRHIAMAHYPHPLSLKQGANDLDISEVSGRAHRVRFRPAYCVLSPDRSLRDPALPTTEATHRARSG